MTRRHAQLTVVALAVLAFAAGCTNGSTPTPSGSASPALSASTTASPAANPGTAPSSAAPATSSSSPPAGTINYSVTDWAVPRGDPLELGSSVGQFPSATVDSVEIGRHPKGSPAFTRVSFRFRDALPSCRLVYVREFRGTDDKVVLVPGNAKLAAVFHTAASPASGTVAMTGDGKPVLQAVVKYDDFEGYLAYGLGLQTAPSSDQTRPVRCGRLQYTDGRAAPYVVFVDIQG